ncbi:hypothetical protein PAE9249_01417 [Paenibacillus sp. CECT 9249]|nr:hypothetical protein PAE9249_01417 [Paenibacillus sp. CECT 9249]
MSKNGFRWIAKCLLSAVLLCVFAMPAAAASEETTDVAETDFGPELHWIEGGGTVDLGSDLAELKLGSEFVFLDGADSRQFQMWVSGSSSSREIGTVFPADENEAWYVLFEYDHVGHIKDKEKNKIDADAILDSYKQGTEERNKEVDSERQLFIDGWHIPPSYDDKTHQLSWALLAHDIHNEKLINYNVRLLTREGYISAILVTDPDQLDHDRTTMEKSILPNFQMKTGQRYEDFDQKTDKVSEYGLSGLILGGAGLAVAKKVGLLGIIVPLLKKGWILIVAAIAGVFGFIKRKITGRRKEDETVSEYHTQPEAPSEDSSTTLDAQRDPAQDQSKTL